MSRRKESRTAEKGDGEGESDFNDLGAADFGAESSFVEDVPSNSDSYSSVDDNDENDEDDRDDMYWMSFDRGVRL
jgi:hypothetical protein